LLKQLGEGYGDVLAEHRRILRDAVERCEGREVDNQGDSFFFAFASAKSALAAAVIAQRELAQHHWPEGGRVRVRMGLHTGEPAVGEERYVGLGVHRAARIGAVGHGGQVLLSNATRELVEDEVGGVTVRSLGAYRLKDIDRPEPLFQLDIDGLETDFPPLSAERAPEPHSPRGRWLVAGAVAAAILVGVVAAVIIITGGGGSAPKVMPNSVLRIDPKTLKATQVAQVGDAPDLLIDSGGYLWITNDVLRETGSNAIRNAGDHTLVRVDPATGKAVVVGGGLAPCGLTADPSGDVWVANCYPPTPGLRDDVIRVDARTLAFRQTLPVPGGDSYYRGVAYGGGSLWLSQVGAGASVVEINPETGAHKTIPLDRSSGTLAWSEGYGDLWITNFDEGSMTRLRTAPPSPNTVEGVAENPGSVVVEGNVVWVGDWSAPQIARLSAVGPPQPRRIPLPRGAAGVWNIAVGAGAVWAAAPDDDALWRIDEKTNAVTRVNLPYAPTGVTADATNVWVTVRK
jgi:streptogramin lyase